MSNIRPPTRDATPPRQREVSVRAVLTSQAHSDANRRRAKEIVWRWVGARWPRLVPLPSAMNKSHIECNLPGLRLLVSKSKDASAWMLEVAQDERGSHRTWITQAVVADTGAADMVAVQTSCSDLASAPQIAPPRLLGAWVERLELDDAGVPVSTEPRSVQEGGELDAFVDHLFLPERRLPIVALSNKRNSRFYGVDPRGLAEAVRGLAHVACLTPEAVDALAERVGRQLAPVAGAARIYLPGFTAGAGVGEHPLVRAPARRPVEGEAAGAHAAAFRKLLLLRLCAISARAPLPDGLLPGLRARRAAPRDTSGNAAPRARA